MKNIKGVTLIALIVTIMVLGILSTVAIYSGKDIINSSKLTTYTAEMKIMQTEINSIYDKYINGETIKVDNMSYVGDEILNLEDEPTDNINTQKDKIFQELSGDSKSGVNTQEKEQYKYWSNDLIKKLGIEGTEQSFFVNVKRRSVISCQGLEYEGKMYYTLNQLPDNLYNVEYNDPNTGEPTFDVTINKKSENKWQVAISNIQYSKGYIEKWQVKYKLEKDDYWSTTEDLSFIINKAGKYVIKILNGEVVSEEVKVRTPREGLEPGVVATETKKDNYTDDNGDKATVPEEFKVSENADEQNIDTGLVVVAPDGSEFVWVPVPYVIAKSENEAIKKDGEKIVGKAMAVKVSEEDYRGILYNFTGTESSVMPGCATTNFDGNANFREPAVLKYNNGSVNVDDEAEGIILKDLQIEYKKMIDQVEKYKGFYVGRYETSYNGSNVISKKDKNPMTSADDDQMWYGMYNKQKNYASNVEIPESSKKLNDVVGSSMIWGSQYDAIMNWILTSKSETEKNKVTANSTQTEQRTTGTSTDIMNKIYDLGNNLYEWTLESSGTDDRACRGGYYNNTGSPSHRDQSRPFATLQELTSRLILYIM